MHYIDTSVLIAYLVPEKYSVQVDRSLRDPALERHGSQIEQRGEH